MSNECGLSDALRPELALIVWQFKVQLPLTARQREQARAEADLEGERKEQDLKRHDQSRSFLPGALAFASALASHDTSEV